MMPLSSCTEVEKLIKTDPIEDYYDIGPELGRGKFAVVKRCTDKKSGCVYAAKFLRKRRRAVSCREEIITEIDIMRQAVSHPGVIQLQEVYESQREIVIILEIAKGGELFRLIAEDPLGEEQAREVTFQILDAVSHLHDYGIVHLDLKPENVLLAEPGELVIRVADFGLAVQLRPGQQCCNLVGTPEYVAPEILNYEPLSCASDMWSIGAMTYALLAGYSPFQGEEELETFLNVSKVSYDFDDEIFENVSEDAKDFISRLLRKDARKRMTARKCLEHSWLTKAKRATARMTAKAKGKPKSDSCCESLSSTDSPYDISQDSTSSLDVSPLSSASSSFSPAAGKPSDDETLSTTPVKSTQPDLGEKVSSYLEKSNDNSDLEKSTSNGPSLLTEPVTSKNSVKDKYTASVKKSSPLSTPSGSFGSTRSAKQLSSTTPKQPSSTTQPVENGTISIPKSTSDPACGMSSEKGKSPTAAHSNSTTSINKNTTVSSVDTSQVVMRRKGRGKGSAGSANRNEEVKSRNKVDPESLPNYSRDSYRRNSLNFGDSTDADVMDFLRKGSLPSSSDTSDFTWPPPSQSSGSGHNRLNPITEHSSAPSSRRRDKSPKISIDAQITLLDQLPPSTDETINSDNSAEGFQPLPSPKIPLEAIHELQSELKVGLEMVERSCRQLPQQQTEEQKRSSPTAGKLPRSKRASSPKISMEAQLEILDILVDPDSKIEAPQIAEPHIPLKRKLSQPKATHFEKNPERITEWKTLPRRHSSAKTALALQSKPIKTDNSKTCYTPTGPFQFLPNPNSRLVDRRPSLPVNSRSASQLPSRPLNGSQSPHGSSSLSMERSTTPLAFHVSSNPSSRCNSPLHGYRTHSPVNGLSTNQTTLSPGKISHWKSCEELDK